MEFLNNANQDVHFEFSTDKQEVEIYIGGWFLAYVMIDDISPEAKDYLFKS